MEKSRYDYYHLPIDETNKELLKALSKFYLELKKREGTLSDNKPEYEDILSYISKKDNPKVIYATDNNGNIVGHIAGYSIDYFNKENFQLNEDVPEGVYYFIFGLGNTSGDLSVILGLAKALLDDINTDFCLCLVSHEAPIYKKSFYPKRGWREVKSSLEKFSNESFFYIEREEVIR